MQIQLCALILAQISLNQTRPALLHSLPLLPPVCLAETQIRGESSRWRDKGGGDGGPPFHLSHRDSCLLLRGCKPLLAHS